MYKEIVKQSLGKGSEEVMHKSVELVDELLMEIKQEHPQRYWRFIREQQGLVSGGHYDVYVALNAFWHDLSCVIEEESVRLRC